MQVYDADGHVLGEVPLTPKQLAVLDAGEKISVLYHTPQLLRSALGERSGSFMLKKVGDRIVAPFPEAVKECLELHAAVKAAREAPDA